MTDAAQVALLVLAGLFVGLLIPLVVSARALFKRTDKTLERLEPKLTETLEEVRTLVRRSDALVESFGSSAPKLALLADRLDRFADGLDGARSSSVMARAAGSALGAALAAGWSTYLAHRHMTSADNDELDAQDAEPDEAVASAPDAPPEPGDGSPDEEPDATGAPAVQQAPSARATRADVGPAQTKHTGTTPEVTGGHSPAL